MHNNNNIPIETKSATHTRVCRKMLNAIEKFAPPWVARDLSDESTPLSPKQLNELQNFIEDKLPGMIFEFRELLKYRRNIRDLYSWQSRLAFGDTFIKDLLNNDELVKIHETAKDVEEWQQRNYQAGFGNYGEDK